MRTCEVCGTGIDHRQGNVVTCSTECSAARRLVEGRKKAAAYRLANPEKVVAQRRSSYAKNRSKRLAEAKSYYENNKEERRRYAARWNSENAQHKREYSKQYHKEHADRLREKARDRYWADPDAKKAYNADYNQRNRGKRAEAEARKRAALEIITKIQADGLEALL